LNQTLEVEKQVSMDLKLKIKEAKNQAKFLQEENSKILNINANNHREIVLYQAKVKDLDTLENDKAQLQREL